MRHHSIFLLVLCCAFLTACAFPMTQPAPFEEPLDVHFEPYHGEKMIIAVIGIRNTSQNDSKEFLELRVGYGISNMLKTSLLESGKFRVVERESAVLKKMMAEQWLGKSGAIDNSTIVKLGKMLGAGYFVYGKVSEFGIRKYGVYAGLAGARKITTRIVIDAYVADTQTGEVLCAATGIGATSTQTAGVFAIWEEGVEKFDETTVGKATRIACYKIAQKLLNCN